MISLISKDSISSQKVQWPVQSFFCSEILFNPMRSFQKRNRISGLVEVTQTESLNSPKQDITAGNAERLGDKLATIIERRISKLHNLEKMRVIKNVMYNLYGRHNPIDYKPDFNFQQTWQTSYKENTLEDKYKVFKNQNYLYIVLHFLLCILFAFSAWFFSVYRIYLIDCQLAPFVAMIVLALIVDAIIKQNLLLDALADNNLNIPLKEYLKMHWHGLVVIFYLILLLVEEYTLSSKKMMFLYLADLCFVAVSYRRFKDLYEAIKIKILGSRYRNEIMIAQLFGGCILLVHIFGLVLFLVSFTNSDNNWTEKVQTFSSSWISKYIYSLYFACTTALTVGYGDITPQNLFEIVTILCVQVLGLINMGYIVNEIGRILSKMSENQELLHKNISEAEKITKNYKLPLSLAQKMKTYIINNQIATDELNVEEEDHFMRRLNQEIRQQVNSHHQLSVIKSSIFFICHWSKKFQRKIATKLIRSIYSPQQTLSQIHGHERLYILTRGKLSIEASREKSQHSAHKSMQMLCFDPKKDVQSNTFGYTALISGLNVNLRAVAKDYSICYYLQKRDILDTIVEDESDFNYFHEIKARIEQTRFKQIWQAPNISNTREHYMPNPYYIIQKDKNQLKKTNKPQKRKEIFRKNLRSKWYIQSNREKSEQEIQSEPEQSIPTDVALGSNSTIVNNNTILSEKERQMKYKAIQASEKAQCIVSNRKYRSKYPRKVELTSSSDSPGSERLKAIQKFEEIKNFKAFYPKFNFISIAERYNRIVLQRGGGLTSSKTGLSRVLQNLGEDLMKKLLSIKRIGTESAKQ